MTNTVQVTMRMEHELVEESKETLEAIKEAEDISAHPERYKSYVSFDDMMQDLHVENELRLH